MNAIEQMMFEHRNIEKAISALENFCETLQDDGGTDKKKLGDFVQFLSTYADRLHHGKEEGILFKAMNAAGLPEEEGPVAAMLIEHDQGRHFIDIMRTVAGQDGDWDDGDRETVFQAGMSYAALLTEHIMKEDEILYPMSEQVIPADKMAVVDAECAEFDTAEKAEFERMLELAETLG